MPLLSRYFKASLVVLILISVVYIFIEFYPYIFAKTIVGKIYRVQRIDLNIALMQGNPTGTKAGHINPELFSYSVAVQSPDGEVHTASAEDRQWGAVNEGLCVTAKFFPYPPWKLDKSGTYYGARLLESHICN